MGWFNRRASVRAPSSRTGQLLVVGLSTAVLAGLTFTAAGGFAQTSDQSPGAAAAAKKRSFVRACVQRHDVKHSQGDLNVLKSECAKGQRPLRLALWPVKRKAGKQGAQGPPGPQGPAGAQGPPGSAASAPEYGVATVYVKRGTAAPARFATYSATLGSPVGTTTGGQFRFTCKVAQAPCKVSLGAAVISSQTGTAAFYPRLEIHKEDAGVAPPAPQTFCEYADGATNNLGVAQIARVTTGQAAVDAMRNTAQPMGIGSSLDCGAGQTRPPSGIVTEIWVPAGSNGQDAFYSVWATLAFGGVATAPQATGE